MLQGKVWWITGASSGLGAALAAAFAARGARLILSGRNRAALEAVAAQTKTPTLTLPFEATDFDQIASIVDVAWTWAAQNGSGVYGLINNAGVSQRSLAVETTFAVYQRIIAVDLLAPIALTQALLPKLAAAGAGHVIAISSVAGIVGAPLRSGYSAAKHGLIGYHDSVRAEVDHLGVKVMVVAPGSVRTNVSRNALNANAEVRGVSDEAIESGMSPEEAAARLIAGLERGDRELILADGVEAQAAVLRRRDPNALFDLAAQQVGVGYAKKMGAERR